MAIEFNSDALDFAVASIGPYLYAAPEQLDLLALWSAHTHRFEAFAASPRLSIRSMVPGCGKTTALNLAKLLSARGENMGHTTPASLYTLIDSEHPTLCLDEIDNLFSSTGFSRANPALQAVLNDGYTRDGTVRVMRSGVPTKLSIYGTVAFGGIGRLPAAMNSRAVPLMMTKGLPAEVFDTIIEGPIISFCSDMFNDWLSNDSAISFLRSAERRPEIAGLSDPRSRQIAAPLLAIASLAGPEWQERGMRAIRHAFLGVSEEKVLSRAQMALRDAVAAWDSDASFMTGEQLTVRMAGLPNSVWAKVFNVESKAGIHLLASLLKSVGVSATNHRIEGKQTHSYSKDELTKAQI